MKKRLILIITAVLLTAAPLFISADDYFTIDHYQVDMDVMENNSYSIVETIDVNFKTERHGIFREIPLKFDDMPVKVSNISVPGFDTSIDKTRDSITIRIGSADEYVNGKVSYSISYIYDVGADNLENMDEFNHNIIGDQWDTLIMAVDFRINMPKAFDASKVNCTSGYYGDTDNTNIDWQVNGNVITGKTLGPLGNYEALTVALPLPEGYWIGAEHHKEAGWLLFTALGFPLYAVVIVLAFILWFKKGRDNKLFPAVEFEPPEGMTPSEIGYVIDGSVDNKDVTSLIIYWADKGYLEIEEETTGKSIFKKKKLNLIKIKEPDSDAADYEKKMFKKLFALGSGGRVSTDDMTNKFYKTVAEAKLDIKKSFTDNKEKAVYTKGSGGFVFLTGLLAALPIMAVLAEGFLLLSVEGPIALLSMPFSLFLVIPSLMVGSAITGQGKGGKSAVIFAVIFGGFSLVFFGILTVVLAHIPAYKYLSAIGSSIIVSIFVSIMSKRTDYGDRILEKTLGFKEFIKTAEKDKLELMFDSNPQYFYSILPYAMVLGLSDKWSSHFDGMALEPPRWYRGYGYTTFSAVAFSNNLNGSFKTLNSSMNSSPSSSGSSGSSSSGGFSGGGSGGGGGGSW